MQVLRKLPFSYHVNCFPFTTRVEGIGGRKNISFDMTVSPFVCNISEHFANISQFPLSSGKFKPELRRKLCHTTASLALDQPVEISRPKLCFNVCHPRKLTRGGSNFHSGQHRRSTPTGNIVYCGCAFDRGDEDVPAAKWPHIARGSKHNGTGVPPREKGWSASEHFGRM